MSSVRLTNDMREILVRRLLTHRYKDAIQAIIDRRAKLAADVYDDVYSKATRLKMNTIPEGWLPEDNGIRVQFGESPRGYARLTFDGRTDLWSPFLHIVNRSNQIDYRLFPQKDKDKCLKVYPLEHEFSLTYEQIAADWSALKKQVKDTEVLLTSSVATFTTVAAMIKDWPEAEPFVRDWLIAKPIPLPAVPRAKLNAILDLPVENAAAVTAQTLKDKETA
jgi:hypothetical protein